MPRDHARTKVDIWGDDDWLDLTVDAQMLYFTLYTSAGLSLCGSGDWHPGKLCNRASDWTLDRITTAAAELSRGLFLIIDPDTDEYLIRSWIKHDGLWRTPNMAVSVSNARAELASRILRGVVVFEVQKLADSEPESKSWEKPAVQKMLTQKAVDPAGLPPFNPGPNGGSNPTSNGASKGGSNPYDSVPPTHGVKGGSKGGPTTTTAISTTATTTSLSCDLDNNSESESRPRMILIPDDWAPNDLHRAKYPRPDLNEIAEGFRDHAIATGRTCHGRAGWDAAFSNWVRKSKPPGTPVSTTDARIAAAQALKEPTPNVHHLRGLQA
ncbi:RepA-like replication initiator [Gordonia phage BearBQ]|nr:RepA-like replication initiator [Gordonia phage BearBQ]